MVSRLARSLVMATLAATLLASAGALPALAKGGPPGGGGGSSTTGNDISWPQCGGAYPSGQAFGIVGVNHGVANTQNLCFGSELAWAWTSTGKSAPGTEPRASLYVNTADPGQVTVTDWPTNNRDPNGQPSPNPGTCDGSNSIACAWQYGWNRAIQDMLWLTETTPVPSVSASTTPGTYTWWLDVETGNTWETGAAGIANNVADLQGMVAAFESASETGAGGIALGGASVGIYSTSSQWGQITGTPSGAASGNLAGLANWIPGARTASAAASNCSVASFTGGKVTVTQWFGKPYDGDYACA